MTQDEVNKKYEIVIEALEALAPLDFYTRSYEENLGNFLEIITKYVNSSDFPRENLHITTALEASEYGLCCLLGDAFIVAGFTPSQKIEPFYKLKQFWLENYQHHSGKRYYPVDHPNKEATEAFTGNLWQTAQDTNDSGTVEYCANRYELVRCTLDFLRQQVSQHQQ